MARVAMISCNITEDPYPVYPLGMSMVSEAARAQGHMVDEWDLYMNDTSFEKLEQFIKDLNPQYIGLSLRNVDSVNYNKPDSYIHNYRRVVETIRTVSDAPVILGGSAYTIFPQAMLDAVGGDYGVAGEGEEVFCSLLNDLEAGRRPASKILHHNGRLQGQQFQAFRRNDQLASFYLQKGGMLSVQTKRGCPHRCAYCSYPLLEGRRYRHRPVESVVDEIEMLITKYGADYYSITDSVFNDTRGHYLAVAEELVRRGISTPWMCFLRPDQFSKEQVDLLRRSGLSSVEWGTDCSTDQTLQAMHKDFTWAEVVASNNAFARAGISNAHFIIFGGPQETSQTLKEGLENINQLENCVVFAGIGVRIFPGTTVHEWALRDGMINAEQSLLPPTFYFSPQVDREMMHQEILQSFNNRMDRIYPDGQMVEKTQAFHLFGHRGPIWDYLLKKNRKRRGTG